MPLLSLATQALSPFIDPVTQKKVTLLKSADFKKTLEKRAASGEQVTDPLDFANYWEVGC